MDKFLLISTIALCFASQFVQSQYQTAPAYKSGYQQQRKMGSNSQNYGQQQQQQQNSPKQYGSAMMNNAGYQQMSGYGEQEQQHPPMPFNWGYDTNDGYGTTQFHKEKNDDSGKRTGSYGYMDAYGVYRQVDYVADENGFRAYIKTNEPGTANDNPADVDIKAEEPPANTNPGSKQSYGGQQQGYGGSGSSSYGMNSGKKNGPASMGRPMGGESRYVMSGKQSSYGRGSSDMSMGYSQSSIIQSQSMPGRQYGGMGPTGSQGATSTMSMSGQGYGSNNNGKSAPAKSNRYNSMGESYKIVQMMDETVAQQFNSDSALARQYAPSSSMEMMANGIGAQTQQQYGADTAMSMDDSTSTYSSIRVQPQQSAQQSTGYASRSGDLKQQNEKNLPKPNMATKGSNLGYNMGKASGPIMAMRKALGNMDFKRAMIRNIRAIRKRY